MRTRLLVGAGSMVGAGALALSLMGAGNALADSSPVTASVAVPSTVTLTGVSPSINFPETPDGNTAVAAAAESYQVVTNDGNGATLTLGSPARGFSAGGSFTISDQQLQITEKGANAGNASLLQLSVGNPAQLDKTTGPGTTSYSEDWSLAIPSNTPSGTFTQAFTYTATGN